MTYNVFSGTLNPTHFTYIRVRRCHSNESRAPIANPPNSAQLRGSPYHFPSYIRVRAVVWECGEGQTDIHTQTAVANVHFSSATPHAKCIDSGTRTAHGRTVGAASPSQSIRR